MYNDICLLSLNLLIDDPFSITPHILLVLGLVFGKELSRGYCMGYGMGVTQSPRLLRDHRSCG